MQLSVLPEPHFTRVSLGPGAPGHSTGPKREYQHTRRDSRTSARVITDEHRPIIPGTGRDRRGIGSDGGPMSRAERYEARRAANEARAAGTAATTAPKAAGTLDPVLNKILDQRERETAPAPSTEAVREILPQPAAVPAPDPEREAARQYVIAHPDDFSGNLTMDEKIERYLSFLQKIERKKADTQMDKEASFKALDRAVEKKTEAQAKLIIQAPDPETQRRAAAIYQAGGFIDLCKDNFAKIWLGDIHILEGILYCAANTRVLNAKDAVHIHISGSTQTGKSDSVKTALQFVHPADQQTKTFSPMYLFHASKSGDLHEKMLIFTDDTVLDPDIAALYRNVLTSWFSGVDRGTVVNNEPKTLHIPQRVSLILTSIDSVVSVSDEGQDESRFLTLEVRRTKEQMAAIRQFIQGNKPDIKKERLLCCACWDLITPREITLHKVIEKDLPIREFKRFLTLCQARAILCNRSSTNDEDFDAIEKFLSYSRPMINSTTPALSRKEGAVLGCLSADTWLGISEITEKSGLDIYTVYRALHGIKGTFRNPAGGLMQKEPRLMHKEEKTDFENNVHLFKLRGA